MKKITKLLFIVVLIGLGFYFFNKASLNKDTVSTNEELISHMRKKFPDQANWMTIIKDTSTTDEYFQLIYSVPKNTDPKYIYKEITLELLKVISENKDELTNLNSFAFAAFHMDEITKQIDGNQAYSTIVGIEVIKKLDENKLKNKDFDYVQNELTKLCPKTDGKLRRTYCKFSKI